MVSTTHRQGTPNETAALLVFQTVPAGVEPFL